MGADGKPAACSWCTRWQRHALEPLLRSTAARRADRHHSLRGDRRVPVAPRRADRRQQVKAAPYVLALRDQHMIAGTGQRRLRAQAQGGGGRALQRHARRRRAQGSGRRPRLLGYMAIYAGTAQVTRAGDPATAHDHRFGARDVAGDVLVPDTAAASRDFVPHSRRRRVKARSWRSSTACTLAGQYQVVALNRGSQQGLEPGHVLRAKESQARGATTAAPASPATAPARHSGGEAADRDGRHAAGVQSYDAHELRAGARRDRADRRRRPRHQPLSTSVSAAIRANEAGRAPASLLYA